MGPKLVSWFTMSVEIKGSVYPNKVFTMIYAFRFMRYIRYSVSSCTPFLQRALMQSPSHRLSNQSSDILQHSPNRTTGDRWLKF